VRFDVVVERTLAPENWHGGECQPDDDYDGPACCPLGDVEES
jgi:hypothetical protein